MQVHKELGPGLLESVYEACLCREFLLCNIPFERQKAIPISYKGSILDSGFRIDLVVRGEVIVELKSVESLIPVHEAQMLTYLRLSGFRLGLLINFNVKLLKDGIRRFAM